MAEHRLDLRGQTIDAPAQVGSTCGQVNPDAEKGGLGSLLADHGRCRWMGRNGRAAVDAAFSWDHIAAQTEEVYLSVA